MYVYHFVSVCLQVSANIFTINKARQCKIWKQTNLFSTKVPQNKMAEQVRGGHVTLSFKASSQCFSGVIRTPRHDGNNAMTSSSLNKDVTVTWCHVKGMSFHVTFTSSFDMWNMDMTDLMSCLKHEHVTDLSCQKQSCDCNLMSCQTHFVFINKMPGFLCVVENL